jgi:hypothetical protein
MKPVGSPLREYGLSWPELLREFFLLGIVAIPLIAYLLGQEQPDVMEKIGQALALGWVVAFIMTGVHLSRRPRIVVYENGIGLKDRDDEKTWNWSQITRWDGQRTTQSVNGIPMFRYGANHFYTGEEKLFSVGAHRACADQLANLLILKMTQANSVPNAYAAYQEGQTIGFDGIAVNKNGVGGNKQSARWDEIDSLDFNNDQLRVKRQNERKFRKFGYISPVASYALMGLLDRLRGTDFVERKTAELARSRGQVWATQGGKLGLVTLIVVPPLILVMWLLSQTSATSPVRYSGLKELNAQYSPDIAVTCAGGIYETYAYGSVQSNKHKFLVIDATDGNNPQISRPLQDMLPVKEQAVSATDLTTVVCLWADPYLVGQCPYKEVTRKRYRQDYILSVIDVGTKTILSEDYIAGTMPERCPKTDPDSDLYGELPTNGEFSDWLHDASVPLDQPQV